MILNLYYRTFCDTEIVAKLDFNLQSKCFHSTERTKSTNTSVITFLPYEVNRVIVEKKYEPQTEKQSTVKPVYNGHSQKDQKLVSKTNYRLMQVKSIA